MSCSLFAQICCTRLMIVHLLFPLQQIREMLDQWSNTIAALVISTAAAVLIAKKVIKLFPNSSYFKVWLFSFCLMFNPYVYSLLTKSPFDTAQQLSLLLAVLLLNSNSHYEYLLIGIATGLDPSNLPLSIFLCSRLNKKKLSFLFCGGITSMLVVSKGDWTKLLSTYQAIFLPQTFDIQFNMFWGMLAHMFDRYIILYELVLASINFASLYLVNHLSIAKPVKIMILLFFKQYCSYHCSQLCFLNSLLIEALLLSNYLPAFIQRLEHHSKGFDIYKMQILGSVWAVVALSFFIFNKLLIQKYYNDFTINTGYLQIYITLIWAARAIFLSQLVNTSVSLQKDEKKSELIPQSLGQSSSHQKSQ